jgi:hypothetical protein
MSRIFGPQTGPSGAGTISDVEEAVSTVIQGRLEATPAYYQTDSDEAVQLDVQDNPTTRLAVAIVPPVDINVTSISRYITAVDAELGGTSAFVYLYDNGSAVEPNGDLNGSETPGSPTNMTDEDSPSPYVAKTYDASGSESYGSTGAYKLFDGDPDTSHYPSTIKYIDAGPAVDKGGGKVGIPLTGHGASAEEEVGIGNTTNYDGDYTVEAETTENEIVITASYVAETFASPDFVRLQPSDNNPLYITLDLGSGNAKAFNKLILQSYTVEASFLKEFVIAGSNEDSPTMNTDDDWTDLKTETDLSWPGAKGRTVVTWDNGDEYRWWRVKVTDIQGADKFVIANQFIFIEAQSEDAPGTLLATLISGASVGDTADVWKTDTVDDEYQLLAGKKYWIVEILSTSGL